MCVYAEETEELFLQRYLPLNLLLLLVFPFPAPHGLGAACLPALPALLPRTLSLGRKQPQLPLEPKRDRAVRGESHSPVS